MPKIRFSDRVGATKPRTVLQVGDMDVPLRNSLWNFIDDCLRTKLRTGPTGWTRIIPLVAQGFFKARVDLVPKSSYYEAKEWLPMQFEEASWPEVYNLIEFIVEDVGGAAWFPLSSHQLANTVNGVLEEELSAYRFIAGQLVPISNPTEVSGIENALQAATETGLTGMQTHLEAALEKLALRPTPDYRNSIKESISAVESAARQITGAGSLKDALFAIEKKVSLHPALKAGLLSLYGYTSDDDGIRHAILDSPTVGFDEAKFMLVSCSAFANFLIGRAAAAGLLKQRFR